MSKIYIRSESKRTFFCVFFISILLNFFISGVFNTFSEINNLKNVDFISAELQYNLSLDEKNRLEEKLLALPEIKKISYIDSFIAFQDLQKDLGIVLPTTENPLPDSLRIYVNNLNNIESVQKVLDSTLEIKKYFLNTTYSYNINIKIKFLHALSSIFITGSIFFIFFLINLASMRFKIDYAIYLLNNGYNKNYISKGKSINLFPFGVTITLGTITYYIIYFVIRNWLINNEVQIFLLTLFQFYLWQSLIIILTITGICLLPVKENIRAEA